MARRRTRTVARSRAPVTSDRFTFSYRCPTSLAKRLDEVRWQRRIASRTAAVTLAIEQFVRQAESTETAAVS